DQLHGRHAYRDLRCSRVVDAARRDRDRRRTRWPVCGGGGWGIIVNMRSLGLAAAVLAACASGKSESVDAGDPITDAAPPIDSACGALPCDAIYVERSGVDSAPGTRAAPMKTISAAIAKAAGMATPHAVFVKSGVYPEPVTMMAGVDVYGGF